MNWRAKWRDWKANPMEETINAQGTVRRQVMGIVAGARVLGNYIRLPIRWCAPESIEYMSGVQVELHAGVRVVKGGDWDALTARFVEQDFYRASEAVFVGGRRWEETAFYRRIASEISAGVLKWYCATLEEFHARLRYLEVMFNEMGEKGYVPPGEGDPVSVNIGRYGDLLFNDGQHRLAFARLLKFPTMPVTIAMRHREWMRFLRQIFAYAARHRGFLPEPICHPDLEDVPAESGPHEFMLIEQAMRPSSGPALVLDCRWGYYCFKLEQWGFSCVGVEPSDEHARFLSKVRRAGRGAFETHEMDVLDFLRQDDKEYDVVLALRLFERADMSRDDAQRAAEILRRLHAREIFLIPDPRRDSRIPVGWAPRAGHYVDFVREVLAPMQGECIGHVVGGRPLYRFRRG